MKKQSFNLIRTILATATMFVLLFLSFGCDNSPDPDDALSAKVNPEFEMNPPIPKDYFIRKLSKPVGESNFLLEAVFEKGLINDKFLAINVNDTTVVLRDDGKRGDETAGDGVFSIALKEDENNLRNELSNQQTAFFEQKLPLLFENRSIKAFNREELGFLDFKTVRFEERVRIPGTSLSPVIRAPHPNLKTHSLMITDLGVVEDPTRTFNPCANTGNPNGVWTFGNLMRELASPSPGAIATDAQVSQFVLDFFNTWNVPQTINGENVPARPNIMARVINDWLSRSAADGAPPGQLVMKYAPFKLLAIVNRLDLRGNSGYGFSNAGEGRFVFGLMNSNCARSEFTIIFEYGINKRSCTAVKAFAQEWEALASSGMTLGSAAYNTALQKITDQFIKSGTNPGKPNQSSLNQLRTNEIALASPWELREFVLGGTTIRLEPTTVKQEPAVKYNAKVNNPDVVAMANWVNTVGGEVPLNFPGTTIPFLGGKAHTLFPPTGPPPTAHHWNGTPLPSPAFITDDNRRHQFSLQTCSGCHGGETQTFFTHVSPANMGSQAALSGFLTGSGGGPLVVKDAANRPLGSPATERNFNDLERRALDLNGLVNRPCRISRFPPPVFDIARQLKEKPLAFTH